MEGTNRQSLSIIERYQDIFQHYEKNNLIPRSPNCEVKICSETDNILTIQYLDSVPVYYNIIDGTMIMIGKINPDRSFNPPMFNLNVEDKEFLCKIKEIWNKPHTKGLNND